MSSMIEPTLFYQPVQVQRDEIWQLGQHRLLCGDCTQVDDVARLFNDERFTLCFTSPPYSDQREYKLGVFDWHATMCCAFDQIIAHGQSDCHILINLGLSHKKRQVDMYWLEWLMYCANVGWPLFGWYVWDKLCGMPGEYDGRLASTHEFIFHFNRQRRVANKWIKSTGISGGTKFKGGRNRDGTNHITDSPDKLGQEYKIPDSVIRINRAVTTHKIETNHPAVFPVALPEFIMQTWSQSNDIVYEPFCGSGTSIIAAENLHRRCFAMEIEPAYCELAIYRWQQMTAQQAQLVEMNEMSHYAD